jgi:hypothetical protein
MIPYVISTSFGNRALVRTQRVSGVNLYFRQLCRKSKTALPSANSRTSRSAWHLSRTARMRRRTATSPWLRALANSGPCAAERAERQLYVTSVLCPTSMM